LKVLEITPLKDKKLTMYILEKEYNEPFWITEPVSNSNSLKTHALYKPSIGLCRFLENLVKKVKPDFVTDELGMRTEKEFHKNNALARMLREEKIALFPVDIDENAKAYFAVNMDKKRELRDRVLEALEKFSEQNGEDSVEKDYLVTYGQCLQHELEELEREINFSIRENWIVMGILDHAKEINNEKDEITCIHISSPEHVEPVKRLLESLDVRVEVIKISKKIVTASAEASSSEIENLLQSMQIQVKPIVGKTSDDSPYLLFYLDTDKKASPFDICMAYDAGFNAVIPYENVTPEDARRIVQDALFSRTPKAAKHTCFLIGGKNAEKAEEVFKVVKDAMFPPFKASIIIDPGGAYTTAAAMVAKVEDALKSHNLGDLKDKTCAVLGTGAVGQIVAVLLAKLGCNVFIASINPERADGNEHAESVARFLNNEYGVKVQGVFAPTADKKIELLKKADVVFCAGSRGVRVIEKEWLKELKLMKVIADVNAIPPFGVEEIELKDDMREIAVGIFGIGALTIGDLKHKLEKEILREAKSNGKEIYNYTLALQTARKLLQKELSIAKLELTLNYPRPKKD